jgi:PAS domain S-box-containing protein
MRLGFQVPGGDRSTHHPGAAALTTEVSASADTGRNKSALQVLWESPERVFCRVPRSGAEDGFAFMSATAEGDHPTVESMDRLVHEYDLRSHLDASWALRPTELVREHGQTMLFVDYAGGEPLDHLLGQPMGMDRFLKLALRVTSALGRLHEQGLVHKDIKPANVLVDVASEQAWLTGFGIASRLPRERQSPEPPEFIAGTLAYMAPEQTGRVNRSIDSRSDLYSLGVTFYEMLTGTLPFTAADPMEWVHCHIARQPMRPSERVQHIPAPVSAITMKLLAKTVEERYQTAAGVERDLRQCLSAWETQGQVRDFALGTHDTSDRLMIPEKLYGRDRELGTLLAAFDRVVAGGKPELVLVSGYSGIGKSAVVNELHKPLVPPRGLFASGKFDQYKRDIPYATLAQAFQSLIRPLLNRSEEEVRKWRDALSEALEPNGLLMVDLVPNLKHIIGEQPPVPELPPQEAQRRFQLVFRRFIGVFARSEHPLALFLDDLQWLDAATLDLLEDLLTRDDLQHLLLIGAYRDNEVSATHPLMLKLDAIRQAGAAVQDILLAPLARSDLRDLLVDSLHCEPERADPLANLIHEKTSGNPFFALQFISSLADERLLSFDYGPGRWSWNLGHIQAQGYTDNVVELMVGRLNRLPLATQEALKQFACMGNSAEFGMLGIACEKSVENLHQDLWEAFRAGIIFRSDISYRFLHDRVQEAAYSMIPQKRRAAAHLRIGQLLDAHTPDEKREDAIFEIVNQLNRGSHLLSSVEERDRVADLNLLAGRRAKVSTAYASALKYLAAGRALLTEETWVRNYPLIFQIECLMGECELLTADKVAAEARLTQLPQRANNRHDFCLATRLRLTLHMTLDQPERAVEVFLEWLHSDGTVWSKHPTRDDAKREYARIWEMLGDRQIEALVDLPLVTDPEVLDTVDVFTEIVTPAFIVDEQLSSLVVCRLVTLSLEHGNCDASCFAYVWLGMFGGPRFGDYRAAFRFGQLGYDLVEKRGLRRGQARTYISVGAWILPWAQHVASGCELIRRGYDAAYRAGDLTFAAYSWVQLGAIGLAAGEPLAKVQAAAETGLAFAKRAKFGLVMGLLEEQLGVIRTLRGLTPTFGCLDHDDFTELETERQLASNANTEHAEFYYSTRKLQARFFAGDYTSAVEASLCADRTVWSATAMFETADHQLYGGLAHAAAWDAASPKEQPKHVAALTAHHKQLAIWAEHNPATFENRAAIVGAELARVEGRPLDAQDLYEKAIRSARINGFVQNEAFTNELAGRFYAGRGFDKIANTYLRDARNCYLRWGADGKVKQLDLLYPQLAVDKQASDSSATVLKSVEHLDLATVIKVSEAISGEIVLERLIDTLLRTAIEHAGAERGLLILPRGDEHRIEAEISTNGMEVAVRLRQEAVTAADLPESVFRYVLRTKERVLLSDASGQNPFSGDQYICDHRARSVLCLPIVKQARLLGMLYLENNLTPHAFTPARMAILKLLASEAAISMENARLYRDLAEREGRIRRLVDANIIGIVISDVNGQILEANDAFLRIVGYDREDVVSKRVRWTDMTPPEWRERDARQLVPELMMTGRLEPFEKEFFRKDGSRVPVLIGVANFEDGTHEGVAFVLDLTERRRAAEALRALQMDLAHANRIATMGQLSASIAHEINQPLAGIITNASTCQRMLATDPPNLDVARETLRRTIRDGNRASEVITRLRSMFSKKEATIEAVDLSESTREVIALALSELQKGLVDVRLELDENLPPARGDRVQLQQVILNLLLNARDAMSSVSDRPRRLVLQTKRGDGDSVCLAVQDSGIGIDAEAADKLFQPFYSTKRDGMGMGLSVSRSIVERHEGRLWVEPNDGPGATFAFSIPCASEVGVRVGRL